MPTVDRSTAGVERQSPHPVLGLQRMAGNRAVARLLQRQPADHKAQFAAIAALEQAELTALGISATSINETRRASVGEGGLQPGLNIVGTLPARGDTGFVDGDAKHVYRGDFLPVSLDGPLPQVAIMLSPHALEDGTAGARSTLRHELTHAKHAQMLIGWLAKWRDAVSKAGGKGPTFAAWTEKQTMSDLDRALLTGDRERHTWNTEVLAHVEGFMLAFSLDSAPPTASAVAKDRMPPAIEELRGVGEKGWAQAADAVKRAALDRVKDFYSKLGPSAQASLREWLFYLLDRSTPKDKPPASKDVEALAARIVHDRFHAHVDLLEALLEVIRKVGFAAHAPQARKDETNVRGIKPPRTRATTVKVGKGTVTASTDIAYRADQRREHGMSLRYEGPDSASAHWLQFIWREVVPDRGARVAGKIRHQSTEYPLTADPAKPDWNTDAPSSDTAFFEHDSGVNRDANSITVFDQPDPHEEFVKEAFARTPKPNHVMSAAHLTDYLVIGMDIVFRSEIDFDWDFTGPDDTPVAAPQLKSAGAAHALDPGPRVRLAQQFPALDYLR